MWSPPPKYDDLGKESRDVFGKGYGESIIKNFTFVEFPQVKT